MLQIEKKRRRAQQIRAQSLALEKIKHRMQRKEQRRREVQRNLVKSMELQSKVNIEKKKQGNGLVVE